MMDGLGGGDGAGAATGFDIDGGFEPQARARSNTWPCPRPDSFPDGGKEPCSGDSATPPLQQPGLGQAGANALLPVKKNSSRRNAWGNLSYADLITQAITSAPDKRLTLSQIYEWMVQNVPYFKDKGDSNSSAGWKNSIRHNLSLHNRFMRVQNEGTGKSSWWMINPDAKPGKSARRRATSMETSKFEKRRGRVKKKVEAMRNGLQPDATPSPSSSVSEGLDLFPDSPLPPSSSFQLSPDFRPRASSNASSCGRLSPIPAVLGEAEWSGTFAPNYSPEQLAGSLAESMKLVSGGGYSMYQTSPSGHQQQSAPPPPPPSYFESQYQRSQPIRSNSSPYGLPPTPQQNNQQRCPLHRLQPCGCQLGDTNNYLQQQQQQQNLNLNMSPSYQQNDSNSSLTSPQSIQQYLMQDTQSQQSPPQQTQQQQQQPQHQQQLQQQLAQQLQQQQQQQQQQLQAQRSPPQVQSGNISPPDSPIPSTMMGQLMGALNNSTLLDDLNINIDTFQGFDCDLEEVLKHELLINGTLDINFQQNPLSLGNGNPNNVMPNSDCGLVNAMDQLTEAALPVTTAATAATGANVSGVVGSNAASAAAAAVYASTNATTPAASPSWVH